MRDQGSHGTGIQVHRASQSKTCTCSLRELLTLKKKRKEGRKEQFGERARQPTAVFPPHVSSSASKSPKHPVTSPNGRNIAGTLAPAPGKRTPLSSLHTHARARARADTRTDACTHRPLPSPPQACPRVFRAELNVSPPGLLWPPGLWDRPPPDLQVTHVLGYLAGRSPLARLPAPRTPRGRVTTSLRPQDLAPRLRAAGPVPGASGWNPGPRERANTGSSAESVPQTSAQPRKGAVAPGMAPSASYPPSPPRDLGFPPATSVEPPRPGEQGADPAGRARSGQGEVPTSQKGRERPASPEEREQRAALDRGARRERSQAESEGRARGPVGQGRRRRRLPSPPPPSPWLFTWRWCSHCRGSRSPFWR